MPLLDKVVYKPLDMSIGASRYGEDDEDDDSNDDDDDEGNISQPFTSSLIHHEAYKQQPTSHKNSLKSLLNLRHLRILLYSTASLLTLVFIIQLTSSEPGNQHLTSPVSLSLKSPPIVDQLDHDSVYATSREQQASKLKFNSINQHLNPNHIETSHLSSLIKERNNHSIGDEYRPQYTSYLTSILHEHNLKQSHVQSTSNFDDPIDDLYYSESDQFISELQKPKWWQVGTRDSGKYITLTNYIRAMKSFSQNASITLTTQATTEFMYHTLELCKRWDGPISVAIFAPTSELQIAITLIRYMRLCLPKLLSNCIKDKVTWHFAYNVELGPEQGSIKYPISYLDSKNYPLFVKQDHCPKFPGPQPSDLIKQFLQDLIKSNNPISANHRKQYKLPYPINVLRNTARIAAKTKYILASDIELYPSINMVPSFLNYISSRDVKKEYNFDKFVFVLPIFEVDSSFSPPKTKQELINLIQKGHAVFFHKYVCDACQNFPNRLEWLLTDKHGVKDYHASDNELAIFDTTQRTHSREWEPIFIGTNEEPYYDDRLTWEGRRDKMGQMYAMCLQDYHLLILGNAFLVHAPGIKKIDKKDVQKRINYLRGNNAIYDVTMLKLRQQYATSRNINKC